MSKLILTYAVTADVGLFREYCSGIKERCDAIISITTGGATELTEETGCRFEFEAYDIRHLYTLAFYADQGLVQPPIFMQFVMGTLGGIGPDVENVVAMKQTADRLFGSDIEWSILGGGRFQFDLVTAGAVLGGHVRVGLEDGIYLRKGRLADSNEEQVHKIVRVLDELSREVATSADARDILDLKGLDHVAF